MLCFLKFCKMHLNVFIIETASKAKSSPFHFFWGWLALLYVHTYYIFTYITYINQDRIYVLLVIILLIFLVRVQKAAITESTFRVLWTRFLYFIYSEIVISLFTIIDVVDQFLFRRNEFRKMAGNNIDISRGDYLDRMRKILIRMKIK